MPDLQKFSAALVALAELSPERLTLGQAAFFLHAGIADLRGTAATFTDIKDALGDTINRSLHTTYKVLVDESRKRGERREPGLGWLTRETDPNDNRRKYLRLTQRGRSILTDVATRLKNGSNP